MSRRTDSRLSVMVAAVHDLLQEGGGEFPHRPLQPILAELFDAEPSWNWMDSPDEFGFELLHPRSNWPRAETDEVWRAGGAARHPLLRWYAVTRDPTPTTLARVPPAIASKADHDFAKSDLLCDGMRQQMPIYYRMRPGTFRAFVLGRDGRDFDDTDVDLALRIQPLLLLLEHQANALSTSASTRAGQLDDLPLTGREVAVLSLLADGCTAFAIGHRLGTSPRTVHKHLEHIYRKLGATDRVTAIRAAVELGVVERVRHDAPELHTQ
jgi:DNA-binding CsgD family transcriptional regulator